MKTFNFSAPSAQRGLWEKEVSAVEQNTATADQIPDISMSLQRIFPKKMPNYATKHPVAYRTWSRLTNLIFA